MTNICWSSMPVRARKISTGCARTLAASTAGWKIFPMTSRRSRSRGKELGALPCGLGARNTLRLEAKLPLYEHEISDTINVWEAGLDRFCKMEKPEFIGRAALEKARAEGLKRVLTGIEMIDRGIARDGYKVQDETGREIGYVTSGSPAPFLKKNIALAY